MITTDDLIFISTIATEKSLAATARKLNVSPPSVSQRLSALEKKIGIRLVERAGRAGIMLTADCERLVARARPILAELDAVSDEIALAKGEVSGHMRIIAPFGFGREHVASAVSSFMQSYPKISIELTLSDQLSRLPESPWDIIIHVGPLSDSSLVAVSLTPNERFLCASLTYIEKYGSPDHPDDLSKHLCLAIREDDEDVSHWTFVKDDDSETRIDAKISPYLSSNDGEVVRSWALAGLGIMQRSEWSVFEDIKTGRLVRVLPDFKMPSAPVVALVSNRDLRAARVQVFLDHLRSFLTPVPWSND
jgi:DNA-binding transcriptional LysR family regulator